MLTRITIHMLPVAAALALGFGMGFYYQGYKIYSGMFSNMTQTMERLK